MGKKEKIISAGLDIGTTTTTIVISELDIENISKGVGIPEIKIVDKRIIYRGDVLPTPFIDNKNVDAEKIAAFLDQQYDLAGISKKDVKTGALIITGEAARKNNASKVSSAVASGAGDFVVASAGAHLEAVISGKGSGAEKYSIHNNCRIMNIDIGGGTTNCSVYENGICTATICMNIGGRLLSFEAGSSRIKDFNIWGALVAARCGLEIKKGMLLEKRNILEISEAMVDSFFSVLNGAPDDLAEKLLIGSLPELLLRPGALSFSGGVGNIFYRELDREKDLTLDELLQFDDIGIALGSSLAGKISATPFRVVRPEETIYATVIGAGVHSTELSGSTIYISDPTVLPLRNLYVARASARNGTFDRTILESAFQLVANEDDLVPAIVIGKMMNISFSNVREIVNSICEVLEEVDGDFPVIVLFENDIGKIAGSLLKNHFGEKRAVISIDQVSAGELEYIDIGKPLYGGSTVPVVLKTLVFSD